MTLDNVYENAVVGATANPLMPEPDEIDEAFADAANRALADAVELARVLVRAHQAAAAVVIDGDWSTIRKYFSLSEKYADWAHYATPATGYGSHGWLLRERQTVRLTQEELEAHPEWKAFGTEAGAHPPMRGWLATPIVDSDGVGWGLLQVSDRIDGDFDERDERELVRLANLLSATLEAQWRLRNARKAAAAGGISDAAG